MSRRVYEIAFQIGGKISNTLNRSMLSAGGQLDQLGRKISEMEQGQGKVTRFRGLHREVDKTRIKLTQAEQEMNGLRQQMQATDKPTKALTARFNAAERRVDTLRGSLKGQLTELRSVRGEMKAAGVSVKSLSRDNERLTRNIKAATRAQQQLREVQGSIAANQQRRGNMRGQMFDAVALGASVVAFTSGYRELQKAQGELATLGVSESGLAVITQQATDLSNQIAGVTVPDFIRASYDIRSGIESISETTVGEFTRMASMTAAATKSTTGEMTNLFAKGYGVYRDQFGEFASEVVAGWHDMSAEERDVAFGEHFSAGISAAVKQFRTDGAQMSQAISRLGASATSMGHSMSDQLAVLGSLQRTMEGSESATRYAAFLRSAAKAGEELGLAFTDSNDQLKSVPQILREIQGHYGETISAVEKQELAKAFGTEEAVAMIDLLITDIDGLESASQGLDSSMRKGAAATDEMARAAQRGREFELMTQRLQNASTAISRGLVPAMLPAAEGLGKLATIVGDLAVQFPAAAKVIGVAAVSLIGLKIASVAGGYALTFLVGGFLQIKKVVLMARTAWLLYNSGVLASTVAAKTAVVSTKLMAAAMWVFNAALWASPITWVVAGIAALVAAGVLLWKNWDTIKAKGAQLWEWMGGSVTGVIRNIIRVLLTFNPLAIFLRAFNKVFDYLTGINLFDAGKTIIVSLVNGIKSRVSQLWEWMTGASDGVVKSIAMALLKFNPVFIFMGAFNKVFEYLTGINLFEAGKAIIMTMIEGIKSKITAIPEMVKGALASAREYLPFSDAKKGPFSDLTASGASIITTLAQGIRKTAADALTGPLGDRMGMPGTDSMQAAGRGLGGGRGMNVTYSPQINLPAGSPGETKRAAQEALTEGNRDLERRMRSIFEERDRLSYA